MFRKQWKTSNYKRFTLIVNAKMFEFFKCTSTLFGITVVYDLAVKKKLVCVESCLRAALHGTFKDGSQTGNEADETRK